MSRDIGGSMSSKRPPRPTQPASTPLSDCDISRARDGICVHYGDRCDGCPLVSLDCGYDTEHHRRQIEEVCRGFLKMSQGITLTPADETPPAPDKYFAEHYAGAIQPLEIMQAVMTREEFCGFLAGNCIKYGYRAGRKQGESAEKDKVKFERYADWLMQARAGKVIDPRKD